MKKLKKILAILILSVMLSFYMTNLAYAAEELIDCLEEVIEYNEDFKEWQELSDEEKAKTIQPSTFVIPKTKAVYSNPININQLLSAKLEEKYDLRQYIPLNTKVRNQQNTNSCWTFSALGSLETTLALRDYKKGYGTKEYNFSERHMEYSTSRTFANNKINENSFTREVDGGGNYYLATAYLTNGSGAVLETDMPFENNSDKIDISEIQNKRVVSQVYDTMDFPLYRGKENTEKLREEMKLHIKNYGGINAGIHGAQLISDYFNNDTGAIYCDDADECPMNHAVVIIGWDDNYDKVNFNAEHRPSGNGAWIIKNSWGERQEATMQEMKEAIFETYPDNCKEQGWNSANDIPNEVAVSFFRELGFEVEGNKGYKKIGDNGYMYVSYEDVNIYKSLSGIIKADDKTNYNNIYQYDYCGINSALPLGKNHVFLATVFNKSSNSAEFINQVSLYAPETYTVKVYVNPNGSEKTLNYCQPVELVNGSSATFDAGYHTLQFLDPIEIKGSQFTVLIEVEGTRTDGITIGVEQQISDSYFENVLTEKNKCFYTLPDVIEKDAWLDFGTLHSVQDNYPNSDLTIKAFTVSSENKDPILESITITKAPDRIKYMAGENFDKTGMVITANYNNGQSVEITDYKIEDGEDLKTDQKSVIITYQGKAVEQPITVEKKEVTSIKISKLPTKTQYVVNKESLDLSGGYIKVEYNDNTSEEISMKSENVSVQGFSNSNAGLRRITITYGGKSTTFDVEIIHESEKEPDTPTVQDEAENSVFTYVKSNLKKRAGYNFSDKEKTPYATLTMELNNITRKVSQNDTLKYYYYLSSSPSLRTITDWILIDEAQNSLSKLEFTMDTRESSNYSEITTAPDLYLYVKEIATKGSSVKEYVTPAISVVMNSNTTSEIYIDGVKQGTGNNNNSNNDNQNNNNNNQNNNNNNNNQNSNSAKDDSNKNTNSRGYVNSSKEPDDTTATGILPKTGTTFVLTMMFVITIAGIVMYVKYERIDK